MCFPIKFRKIIQCGPFWLLGVKGSIFFPKQKRFVAKRFYAELVITY